MKTVTLIIIFSFLFISFSISQSGWVSYSTGSSRAIHDIYFLNANTGWAVGDSVIVKSTNGGVNWVRQNYSFPITTYLYSVKFINENTGYSAGGEITDAHYFKQYIFKTTNGGSNWYLLYNESAGNANYLPIKNIFPLSDSVIYIAGKGTGSENQLLGSLRKSTNGGINFSTIQTDGIVTSAFFLNSNTGWISNQQMYYPLMRLRSYLLKTTNGGVNWDSQYCDSSLNIVNLSTIQFLNENTGYAVGSKLYNLTVFFKTTDGGTNWQLDTFSSSKYLSMFFINQNTGWICGGVYNDSSGVLSTTNRGVNWHSQFYNIDNTVNKLFFINSYTGWAVKEYSSDCIFKTTTGGIVFTGTISTEIPDRFTLYQNYPNPFNPSTNIKYSLAENGKWRIENSLVTLKIYDLLGKVIATLVNEKQSPGTYEVTFDGKDLPSGIYFYRLETEGFTDTKKMILLK